MSSTRFASRCTVVLVLLLASQSDGCANDDEPAPPAASRSLTGACRDLANCCQLVPNDPRSGCDDLASDLQSQDDGQERCRQQLQEFISERLYCGGTLPCEYKTDAAVDFAVESPQGGAGAG